MAQHCIEKWQTIIVLFSWFVGIKEHTVQESQMQMFAVIYVVDIWANVTEKRCRAIEMCGLYLPRQYIK